MEDEKDVPADSSPADVVAESSPVEKQVVEQVEQKEEPPFGMHPRWKEVQAEKEAAKEQSAKDRAEKEYWRGIAEASKQQAQPNVEEPLYQANTPEEKQFWQQIEKVAEQKTQRLLAEKEKGYQQQLEMNNKYTGNLIAKDFLKSHPEVAKGSPEMEQIIRKSQMFATSGMGLEEALEDAFTVVMAPKMAQMAAEKTKQEIKTKTSQKLAANVEGRGVSNTLAPKSEKFEDVFDQAAKDLGLTF